MRIRGSAWCGAAVVTGAALAWVHRGTHRWGATLEEHELRLPGDDLVPDPAFVATRAVSIDAPPEEVWRWLVQIGQDRGGMYSYDGLENLIGLGIHSAGEIHEEWQDLAVGDRVVLVPAGWAGMRDGYSLPVAWIEPPELLVLRQAPPEHPWDAVWSFHLQAQAGGGTRLVSRSRSSRHPGARGAIDLVADTVFDPVTWVMTRRMLLGIKERAEASAVGGRPAMVGRDDGNEQAQDRRAS